MKITMYELLGLIKDNKAPKKIIYNNMVDFNKKVFNTDKFRQAALFFQKHGSYTLAPRGTTDYVQYWD